MAKKNIKMKVEEGEDPRDIHCTTYQMRNPFHQFADGVITELDVHCYAQHQQAAALVPTGGWVLDVCCGRGLLIPFLRYRGKAVGGYVGVDIHPANANIWAKGFDPRRRGKVEATWGFPTYFVESDVASMSRPVNNTLLGYQDMGVRTPAKFDTVVYTSAIEHMQPQAQQDSLRESAKLTKLGGTLYLSCPVTPEGKIGYDTQYAAHIYEPTYDELSSWLRAAGWIITKEFGLCTKTSHFRKILVGQDLSKAERLYKAMPRAFSLPAIAAMFPECATELAIIAYNRGDALKKGKKSNGKKSSKPKRETL